MLSMPQRNRPARGSTRPAGLAGLSESVGLVVVSMDVAGKRGDVGWEPRQLITYDEGVAVE